LGCGLNSLVDMQNHSGDTVRQETDHPERITPQTGEIWLAIWL
jgi:hypothetical protein